MRLKQGPFLPMAGHLLTPRTARRRTYHRTRSSGSIEAYLIGAASAGIECSGCLRTGSDSTNRFQLCFPQVRGAGLFREAQHD